MRNNKPYCAFKQLKSDQLRLTTIEQSRNVLFIVSSSKKAQITENVWRIQATLSIPNLINIIRCMPFFSDFYKPSIKAIEDSSGTQKKPFYAHPLTII